MVLFLEYGFARHLVIELFLTVWARVGQGETRGSKPSIPLPLRCVSAWLRGPGARHGVSRPLVAPCDNRSALNLMHLWIKGTLDLRLLFRFHSLMFHEKPALNDKKLRDARDCDDQQQYNCARPEGK